jgi:hypothetical protein
VCCTKSAERRTDETGRIVVQRISFWFLAAIAAAGIAYVVTVPGALDTEAPEAGAGGGTPAEADHDEPPAAEDPVRSLDPEPEPQVLAVPEPVSEPEPEPEPDIPEVGFLSVGELPFDAECGLVLRMAGQRDVIFASGISINPDAPTPAAMHVDQEFVVLHRAGVDGAPIGQGQFERQMFQDEAETISVVVEISLEEGLTGEWAQVTDGTLTVIQPERPTARLQVGGRVGC